MIYFLNSKKPHENREPLTSSPGSLNMALPGASTGRMPVAVEEHVKGNAITTSAATRADTSAPTVFPGMSACTTNCGLNL